MTSATGSVSKVEMVTPMALIYKVLFSSISTFEAPPKLLSNDFCSLTYVIAAVRVAFGVLLFSVAKDSRAPRTLRVVAFIPFVAGLATPFVGVERAWATIAWWSEQGTGVVRLSVIPLLTLGGFVAYACAPARRAA